MDEARVGLIPTCRRRWAKISQCPIASSKRVYQWGYDFAFVHPATGRCHHWFCSTVDTDMMTAVLAAFAVAVGAGPERQIVLVLDCVGWHRSDKIKVPPHVHLALLPTYSPELQPAEKLFPLINEALAIREFRDMQELEATWARRILALDKQQVLVRVSLCFHWWPKDVPREVYCVAS
jgi:hypothetical protein